MTPELSRGIALMMLSLLLMSCGDAIGKYLTQTYPVLQVMCIRAWFLLAFALLWVAGRGGLTRAWRSQRPLLQIGRSLLLAVEMALFMLSFSLLPLAEVTAVAAVTPLVVTAFAALWLGEAVGWRRWLAVIVGFVGALIVARPGLGVFGWTMLLPLVAVVLWGSYQVLLRLVSRWDHPATTLLYTAVVTAAGFSIVTLWYWQPPDAMAWLWLGILGLVHSSAHLCLIQALALANASVLQPFSYTMLVWAVLLGWAVFGAWPDRWTWLGSALIIGGGLYALYRERRRAEGSSG